MTDQPTWYVARTKTGGELRARLNLERQGFGTFLPREPRQMKRGRQQVVVLKALFPGYIFVDLDLTSPRWGVVNNTFGIARLVTGAEGRPARMPAGSVEALMARVDDDGCLKPPEEIEVGAEMRIVSGAFANWVAEVVAAPDPTRIRLLLDLMGQKVTVTTTRENLART